ncbi:MAG: TetR/AcrR family transcriptional regulator [Gammaproteobacteria bacterium]|nr:TetR/AcrR family transcriptional regulator [Gammaproteobacteria bacterium]
MSRAESSQETIDTILRTATQHFAERGLAGARIDEIARDAGVNKATIYYHIGGKEELYAEVFRDNMRKSTERLLTHVNQQQNAEDKFKAYVDTIVENLRENRAAAPLMMREIASGAENIPQESLQYIVKMLTTIIQILEEGRSDGSFRNTNPGLTHLMIIGSIMFYSAGEPLRKKLMGLMGNDFPMVEYTKDCDLARDISDFLLHALKS